MWCPEGYLRWDEFHSECRNASYAHFRNRHAGALESSAEKYSKISHWGQAMAYWLLQEALEQNILCACSPAGVCLRIKTEGFGFFLSSNTDESQFIEVDSGGEEFWHPVDDEGNPPQEWLKLQFFINYNHFYMASGIIKRPSDELMRKRENSFSDVDDSSFREELRNSWLHSSAQAIMFAGSALCIKADVAKKFLDEIFVKSSDDLLTTTEETATVGRPRSRERAAEAYLRLFPNGRGNIPWKQVSRLIKMHQGVTASPITIKRGLEEMGQNPEQNSD